MGLVSPEEMASWVEQGSQDASTRTYASIKNALDGSPHMKRHNWEVYLQGSYANSTNTTGDSDVDIVVQVDFGARPCVNGRPSSTDNVLLPLFRQDVQSALVATYGADLVQSKERCLRIPRNGRLLQADVVTAGECFHYVRYAPSATSSNKFGVVIRTLEGQQIVNFPKEHRANGEKKNKDADGRYKLTVRQVKRLRRKAVEMGFLRDEVASGYLLECLTYNVPDYLFYDSNDASRLTEVIKWLSDRHIEQLLRFSSCDGIHLLFVNDPGKHNALKAKDVLLQLRTML